LSQAYLAALREDREAAALLVTEAERRASRLQQEGAKLRAVLSQEVRPFMYTLCA